MAIKTGRLSLLIKFYLLILSSYTNVMANIMKLYGSTTSPYVRRLRLLMENIDYEFIHLNIFEDKDRNELKKISPLLKIPVLVNEPDTVFDSRQIFRYLCESSVHPRIDLEQENLLTIIDGLNDTLITLFAFRRAGLEFPEENTYYQAHNERIQLSLAYLENEAASERFKFWDYPCMCLYSLLDWIQFRQLADLSKYPNLLNVLQSFADYDIVKSTDPRA